MFPCYVHQTGITLRVEKNVIIRSLQSLLREANRERGANEFGQKVSVAPPEKRDYPHFSRYMNHQSMVTYMKNIVPTFSRRAVLAILALLPFTVAQAQRETFEVSEYRKEADISAALAKEPTAAVARKGANAAGELVTVAATNVAESFENIYFKLDSTELRDKASADQVKEIAEALKSAKIRNRRFLIEGHTCDLGEAAYNLKLSAQRAQTIRQALIANGVAAGRLEIIGFGETEQIATPGPRADAATAEKLRTQNRRVVLRLLPVRAQAAMPAATPRPPSRSARRS